MVEIFCPGSPAKKFAFCFSRKLTSAEKRYSIFKLELIGTVNGLHAARDLLLFRPIILFIDARSLMFIRLSRNASEQIARLSVQLSSFEVQLYHLPSDMNLADNFTRLRDSDENLDAEETLRPLSEKESHEIVKHLTIPDNFSIPVQLLNSLLNEDGVLIDLPGKKKRKKTVCKEVPRKSNCPSLHGPKKLKDFIIEVSTDSTNLSCNMVATEDRDLERNENSDDENEGLPPSEYNNLQHLVTSSNIFKDGLITKNDFRRAQENDVRLTELIREKKVES